MNRFLELIDDLSNVPKNVRTVSASFSHSSRCRPDRHHRVKIIPAFAWEFSTRKWAALASYSAESDDLAKRAHATAAYVYDLIYKNLTSFDETGLGSFFGYALYGNQGDTSFFSEKNNRQKQAYIDDFYQNHSSGYTRKALVNQFSDLDCVTLLLKAAYHFAKVEANFPGSVTGIRNAYKEAGRNGWGLISYFQSLRRGSSRIGEVIFFIRNTQQKPNGKQEEYARWRYSRFTARKPRSVNIGNNSAGKPTPRIYPPDHIIKDYVGTSDPSTINQIEALKKVVFGIGIAKGGTHCFLIVNGQVIDAWWQCNPHDRDVLAISEIRPFLEEYPSGFIWVPRNMFVP